MLVLWLHLVTKQFLMPNNIIFILLYFINIHTIKLHILICIW